MIGEEGDHVSSISWERGDRHTTDQLQLVVGDSVSLMGKGESPGQVAELLLDPEWPFLLADFGLVFRLTVLIEHRLTLDEGSAARDQLGDAVDRLLVAACLWL